MSDNSDSPFRASDVPAGPSGETGPGIGGPPDASAPSQPSLREAARALGSALRREGAAKARAAGSGIAGGASSA
ncbi:hypothetical protein, partial [Rubellimicrobium mesophilum]|uniref:hypothetical protein n=1 Tax=Rubellimicrobium mesophilum TaxID=1123067 RepID=UPI00055AC333